MQFNSVSDSAGLVQDADFWAGTDANKYTLVHKARNATEWLKKVGIWIWQASSSWKFDDSNLTTLPIAQRDLVANQQDYTLPTSIFKLDRVEVMDAEGNYKRLIPFDKSQIGGTESMDEFLATAGMPVYYDVEGNSLNLYPKPSATDVTIADGLQIYVGRDVDPFVSTDTTKEPGFSEYFHRIVSIGMALDYAIAKGLKDKASSLKKLLFGDPSTGDKGLKGELQEAYGTRDRDFKTKLRVKVDNRI